MRVIQRLILLGLAAVIAKYGLYALGIGLTWTQAIAVIAMTQAFAFIVNLGDMEDGKPTVIVLQTEDKKEDD